MAVPARRDGAGDDALAQAIALDRRAEASITPTGSWPIVRPRRTGYSPFRMCTSVPQIVVVVTRRSASSGPTSGIGFSSSTIRPGSTKTAAFILVAMPDLPT